MSVACFSIGLCFFAYASGQVCTWLLSVIGPLPSHISNLRCFNATGSGHIDNNHGSNRSNLFWSLRRISMVRHGALDLHALSRKEMA